MKAGLHTLLLIALALGQAQAASNEAITLVSSKDAKGLISAERLKTCLKKLLHEWKLDNDQAPQILVLHVSKRAARAALVNEEYKIRRNWSSDHKNSYYEVWIV